MIPDIYSISLFEDLFNLVIRLDFYFFYMKDDFDL
jgi:hypothetical protein